VYSVLMLTYSTVFNVFLNVVNIFLALVNVRNNHGRRHRGSLGDNIPHLTKVRGTGGGVDAINKKFII